MADSPSADASTSVLSRLYAIRPSSGNVVAVPWSEHAVIPKRQLAELLDVPAARELGASDVAVFGE